MIFEQMTNIFDEDFTGGFTYIQDLFFFLNMLYIYCVYIQQFVKESTFLFAGNFDVQVKHIFQQ